MKQPTKVVTLQIEDKVYVSNWMQRYSYFRKWNYETNASENIFPWKTELPKYINESNDTVVRTPKVTQKGLPFKNGETIEVSREQTHKSYEYTIRETITHHINTDVTVALISSNHTEQEWSKVWAQINIKALTSLTLEEQESLKHLQEKKHLQALAKNNLNKWRLEDNLKEFPKELLLTLYDENQNVQFGSGMTKGIVTYNIIPKEYTINRIPLYLSSSVVYNGDGCELLDKLTTSWIKLRGLCTEQKFGI
jgi:hypothetical protein